MVRCVINADTEIGAMVFDQFTPTFQHGGFGSLNIHANESRGKAGKGVVESDALHCCSPSWGNARAEAMARNK